MLDLLQELLLNVAVFLTVVVGLAVLASPVIWSVALLRGASLWQTVGAGYRFVGVVAGKILDVLLG